MHGNHFDAGHNEESREHVLFNFPKNARDPSKLLGRRSLILEGANLELHGAHLALLESFSPSKLIFSALNSALFRTQPPRTYFIGASLERYQVFDLKTWAGLSVVFVNGALCDGKRWRLVDAKVGNLGYCGEEELGVVVVGGVLVGGWAERLFVWGIMCQLMHQ